MCLRLYQNIFYSITVMRWYDETKCEDFLRDNTKHFQQARIINFDIICREFCGEEVPKDILKHYQTVNNKSVSEYPAVEQDEILSSAFRTDRKDFFESKTVIKTLQKNKIKN